MFKYFVILAFVAAASAQYYGAHVGYGAPTITAQGSNILRSYGNLGQVATQTKSISTPYSSVHKSDVRVSNPGLAVGHLGYGGYAAPALAHGYAAPAIAHGYAAPAYHGYAAPAYGGVVAKAAVAPAGLLGVAYSAAPVVSHMTYSNGLGFNYAW